MESIQIRLSRETSGTCTVAASSWAHHVPESALDAVLQVARRLVDVYEDHRHAPLLDPLKARALGQQLADTFLPPLYASSMSPAVQVEGTLLISSLEADLLNLPWELLPGRNDTFLTADPSWSIRRTTRSELSDVSRPSVARPLRILFAACAPTDLDDLDFEYEEEAMLRIVERLGDRVHLDIAEMGTFDELRDLIVEHEPHVVHISGHGSLEHGVGHLCFENERGSNDPRDSRKLAADLFEGRGVYLVFISGCHTAQAGVAGICQSLTEAGAVPVAIGWGASISDEHARHFAEDFYLQLATGRTPDEAMGQARLRLWEKCQIQQGDVELLDASFALPQLYVGEPPSDIVDESLSRVPVNRPGIRHILLDDAVTGLSEGFVGRRRILQRSRSCLRAGNSRVLLLTGMGGTGKSTLATRLANRFQLDGYEIVAVRATEDSIADFSFRIVLALSASCEKLSHHRDSSILSDGRISLAARLEHVIDALNRYQILLVLDNLESIVTKPPERLKWLDPQLGSFLRQLYKLTGTGRVIITCRYVPDEFDPATPGVLHEPMPDFTKGDFFKYLRRHDATATRMRQGELTRELLSLFYSKFGGTPRFVEQARIILSVMDLDELREQIESLEDTDCDLENQDLLELREKYFQDHFLPQLYEGLPSKYQCALSCLAIAKLPLPISGVIAITAFEEAEVSQAMSECLKRAMVQKLGEPGATPHYCVYPLQRDFLTASDRLDEISTLSAHGRAAAYLKDVLENVKPGVSELAIWDALHACYLHADSSGDELCRRWAALTIAGRHSRLAVYGRASAMLRELLRRDRHPSVVHANGEELENLGEWKTAETFYREALAGYRAEGDRAGEGASLHQLGSLCLKRGDFKGARAYLTKSLHIRMEIEDKSCEASTLHNLAAIDMHEGLNAQAREKYLRSLGMKQAVGDRPGEASIWLNLADIDLAEGNTLNARKSVERSTEIFEVTHDRHGVASALLRTGQIDMHEGKMDSAVSRCEEALGIFHSAGRRDGEAAAWNQIATSYFYAGKYEAARGAFENALKIRTDIGDRGGVASTLHGLAVLERQVGNLAIAQMRLDESLGIAKSLHEPNMEANAWHESGLVKITLKNVAGARRDLKKALSIRRRTGNVVGEVATTFVMVHIDLNEGKLHVARRSLLHILQRVRTMRHRAGEAATLHEIASIDLKEAKYDAAEAGFLECMEIRQEMKDKLGEAMALVQMATIAWRRYHDDRAVYLACAAYAILNSIGASHGQAVQANIDTMATELKLSRSGLNHIFENALEAVQWKRCSVLAREIMASG